MTWSVIKSSQAKSLQELEKKMNKHGKKIKLST